MNQNWFNRFFLNAATFPSANVYRRALLRGQLCMIGIVVGIVYTCLDLANGMYASLPYYGLLIVFCAIVFLLNRNVKFKMANSIFLFTLLFLMYAFTDNDVNHTGVSSYLIVYMLVALTLCGHEQIKKGFLFSALAILVFFVAYYMDLPPLIQPQIYSTLYIKISVITNFMVSFLVTFALMVFSININYRSEQEIVQSNQQLMKLNRELDRFVYSASHDLRAPLSSLLGLIQIAQRTHDVEEIRHCLNLMGARVKDLDVFIQEIIDYSRNARQELRQDFFNFYELVKDVSDGLKIGSEAENILINYVIKDDLIVYADKPRMKVILNNLIGNALKYRNVARSDQTVTIHAEKKESNLHIKIEDNGIGIEPIHLPRIFEMFYRASEKSQGSGLGLYIVKETVEKLHGSIEVASQAGHGTVFTVVIPV
ncbi:MAG: HAMP domain-containing histidine kinase [Bacteroidetes bacterium]|nr:HAMP domain-containing histidine kinase [Bacteroidota bacterium]MBS1540509.1 HAMP domain-containing histidine kinase [Bacteroidota bacterium]